MSIEENNSGDDGSRKTMGEEVDYENSGGDEKDAAGGVEGEALVGGEVGGDFRGGLRRGNGTFVILDDGGFLGRGGGED